MKLLHILPFALGVALALPVFAQEANAPKKAKKQYSEPKWMMPPVEGPNLHYQSFDSKAAKEKVSYLIYLPPDYETSKTRRYPVVYWLHGIGGSQQGVPQMAARLTQAIAEKKTPPMIVIYVNGMINSGYSDGRFAVETVTIKELIPHIDANYRTIANRDGRIVEGFSMGGLGAAKWGFKYPDLFGTVSILAGAMRDPNAAPRQNPSGGPPTPPPGMAERNPNDSPWVLIANNLEKIRGRTAVRVVVGGNDGLKETNTKFHELLTKLGVRHEFHVIADAGHSPNPLYDGLGDENWSFYRAALARENVAPLERATQ
jgi:endo-1,4-beta-xylanase